ncbi:acylneuraminate cytidylyltransferase family protein [Paraglaciecola polaris]|uniref:acylneuraminate cytidylyltransferase family protein n=1 Tax=Paraglaciecola polaris TaxID=222814 RepID=UPI0030EDD8DA|tara:strand:+ start:5530 stop:6216 length:687 start_codon:yes stop_codon:yes gene_type:complete
MRIAAIIPARGGSKGVPGKNIRILNEKPLIAYSIDQAIQSSFITDVYVSTDHKDIEGVAKNIGANVIHRPDYISGDNASSESALLHVLDSVNIEFDYIVFLQCTSPIRTSFDIDTAVKKIIREQADSLLSVVQDHSFLWKLENGQGVSVNYDYHSRPRRQDMALQYRENGSIYIFKPDVLRKFNNRLGGKIVLYQMADDSAVDIDTEHDLMIAESILKGKESRKSAPR